ncbi:GtrA family protein [Devosia sp. RR2S18]|uniref:GtrA family protein n=1 Tax=Devosia rhizosphaerae TaxID=3049774 RepID=UPI00253F6BD1|nr:GtrA family protein [Devosia sp. RR2S18]WIJ24041.1 GtrA family protein [Devosia sp. RR2S18]
MRNIAAKLQSLLRTEFVLFCCVGVANTIIHASIVIGLVEVAGFRSTIANTAAFFAANVFSYICNARLTFKTALSARGYLRFLSSSLFVLAATVSIAAAGELAGVHYLVATACLMIVSPLSSYLLVRHFAFGKRA